MRSHLRNFEAAHSERDIGHSRGNPSENECLTTQIQCFISDDHRVLSSEMMNVHKLPSRFYQMRSSLLKDETIFLLINFRLKTLVIPGAAEPREMIRRNQCLLSRNIRVTARVTTLISITRIIYSNSAPRIACHFVEHSTSIRIEFPDTIREGRELGSRTNQVDKKI